MSYIWDTDAQQRSTKPYGFVDLPDDFLEVYRKRRMKAVSFLKEKSHLLTQIENAVNGQLLQVKTILREWVDSNKISGPRYSLGELRNLNEYDTRIVIKTLFLMMLEDKSINDTKALEHYRRILKKAELRKLRKHYNASFLNVSDDDMGLEYYGYWGATLGLYALGGDIQSLSTLLKMNDFLVSQIKNFKSAAEFFLAGVALQLEINQVEKIAQKMRVLR